MSPTSTGWNLVDLTPHHKYKEQRYHDFTCIRCEICDMAPHSPFAQLTCEEENKRKAESHTIWGESRQEFADLTESISKEVDARRDQRMNEQRERWLGVCESRKVAQ